MPSVAELTGQEQSQSPRGNWVNLLVLGLVTALVVGGVWLFRDGAGPDDSYSAVEVGDAGGPGPTVGEAAPGFKGVLTTGDMIDLQELQGKPVWVVFNATWCSNCRSEAPEVQELHDAGDVQVVSVWLRESQSQVAPFMERTGLDFTSVPDPSGQISSQYRVSGVPSHYLIDADGVLRSVHVGALTADQFSQYSQELLDATDPE